MPNLTLKQIDAQIKRTNWRISDIASKYGTDSATYRQATAFLFDTKESKDIHGNVTYSRTIKKEYEDLVHFVTKDDGTTYIAINRNKEAKEKFQHSVNNNTGDKVNRLYNQAKNVKTQGELERQKLGTRYDELQRMPAKEAHKQAIEEIEKINKLNEEFQGELAQIYENFTDNQIKEIAPDLYRKNPYEKRGTLDKQTLDKIIDAIKVANKVVNPASKMPLGEKSIDIVEERLKTID